MMNSKITFLLAMILFCGCQGKYYDYDVNYEGDKLVVNGLIEANVGVNIILSKSHSPAGRFKFEELNIKTGRVWLYQNDTLVGEMKAVNNQGKFSLERFMPQEGKRYKIKAVAEGLDTITSENVVVPLSPILDSVFIKKDDAFVVNSGMSSAFFSMKIRDIDNQKNFYLLDSYVQIKNDSTYNGYLRSIINPIESCEFESNSNIHVFTDKCFDGDSYKIEYFTEHENKGTLIVQISVIDALFHKYFQNLEQPTGLELGFSEPKLAISNIKNGYGVFVAKNTKSYSLKL
jgi:hypothetical protein